jgi:type IV pilus assembly protein PilW
MYRRALASISESRPRHQRGLTLIELMIALVIGLLIVAAMSVLFAGSSQSRREIELSADVNENGRYALDVLSRELSQTGFYGSLVKPTAATTTRVPTDMSAAAAMCLTGVSNLGAWKDSLTYDVLGLGSAAGANIDADPSCITRKAGTDALFIQRASTCAVGDLNCPAESNADAYLQVSECGTEYSATPIVLARGGSGSSTFTLQTKTCAGTAAPKRKLVRRIYYISAANALSYQDIPLSGALPAPVVLVENIEQMQIEYAFDTSSPADGTPDVFAAAPDPLAVPPTDWTQVIGVRIWLLARSSDPSRNTKNAASFVLGADTTVSVAANAAGNPKRRVYSTYISFITPKARSES